MTWVSLILQYLESVWVFLTDQKYSVFWSAMTSIITLLGLGFIYWQIRYGVKTADINLLLSLRDRFWSQEMIQVRKAIKAPENIDWLRRLSREDPVPVLKVYSPEHIARFTIFDYFESIGALYRRDKRLLKIIYPVFGGDIIFHYKLHETFYTHEAVKALYPGQHFKHLAEACIHQRKKSGLAIPCFEQIVVEIGIPMSTKDELLKRTEAEFRALQEAIRDLEEAQLTRPMLGAWSVREILVHLAGWHREMTPALERMARGEKPIPEGVSYDDTDAWNARFVEAKRGVLVAAVLAELEDSHRDFLRAARALPEERFASKKTAARIVEATGSHHYREHGRQIRAWRQRERI